MPILEDVEEEEGGKGAEEAVQRAVCSPQKREWIFLLILNKFQ